MKKTILFISVIILYSFFANAQSGWEWLNPLPTGNHLNSVFFTDTNTGYAVGGSGTILKTTNAGTTWTTLNSGTSGSYLYSVYFTDANTGYAVGDGGTILKTTDAGITWVTLNSGTSGSYLISIYFTNTDTGYAVGDGGTILKTTNAGTTWVTLNSGTTNWLNSVFFTDANTGYAVGDGGTILKTTNAGTTWGTLNSGTTGSYLISVFFTNTNTGYAVGDGGTILKTTDAGTTWTILTSGTTNLLYSVYFTDANTGYAVGGSGTILKTTDAGTTWVILTSGTTKLLRSVYFTDANTGYAVGDGGTILKTTNAGTTWTALTSGTSGSSDLNSVFFTDANTGYAVGGSGTILKTTDAGTTWTILTSGTNIYLYSVYFTDANTGYAGGGSGTILKTTDAGTTWTILTSGTNIHLTSVYFTDANTGYAGGSGGTMLKTTDAGITWFTLNSGTSESHLNSVFFTDANTGYAVGWLGMILKTTDAGTTWTILTSGAYMDLNSVFFTDANTGYAVGGNGTILKTTNAGTTWTTLTNGTTNLLISVFFTDANTGYAVGDETILKTTDAGTTWTILTSGAYMDLNSVFFTDANTGYVVGSGGAILKTYTGGEYINPSIDSLKIASIQKSSTDSDCSLPYHANLSINTLVSGSSYNIGDNLNFHVWFGDGSDTIFTKTIQHIPSGIMNELSHTYPFTGMYSVSCKVTAPDGRTDSLTINDLIIVSDTCGNISGTVYKDLNNNCIKEAGETAISNRKISLFQNNQFYAIKYTNSNGDYAFEVPNIGNYTVVLDTTNLMGFTAECPANAIYDITQFPAENKDFALRCDMGFDLDAYLTGFGFRPGFEGSLLLNVKNNSCEPFNGNIAIKLDPLTAFNSASTSPIENLGDSLVWSFSNLTNLQDIYIPISLQTSTNAWVGNEVCFDVYITPSVGDNDTTNNVQHYCFPILNSWDPNEKEVSPRGNLSGDTTLTYTIHFQNTGNAEAYNIYVLDTIDNNLDLSTFRILSSSHPMTINVLNNEPSSVMKFNFQNIMLPDSTTNELESMGYVAYSIRTKPDLPNGTVIKNTGYIYFDFNPAIVTNTVESNVVISNIANPEAKDDIVLYPNPTSDKVYIQSDKDVQVKVFNLIGEQIYTGNTNICNFVNLKQKGIYIFELTTSKTRVCKKVVVQ